VTGLSWYAVRRWLPYVLALMVGLPTMAVAGVAEQVLITRYYQAILGRTADPGGLAYWDGEVTRLRDAGQNAKEALIAMSNQFFDSPEYRGRNRTNAEFLNDAYQAFFQRPPDAGGLAYWQGQLNQGLPRGLVIAGFQFSPEFDAFVTAALGVSDARIEGTVIIDFYRGYLNRLPDAGGLSYWLTQFRTAQCSGIAQITVMANAISVQFLNSPEMQGRVAAIAAQGCMP
jgi:hypothetical protein